ncbi:MAG TPA: NUDIX domain-containing protein [Candidatus Saccharimonadales bacterium]|nr:NUDIX domain-containing protein [Candidatus Saccharimonadales bacterium]
MIDNQPLHKAQIAILDALRHNKALRFSDLMQPTGLTSDAFKFHIRKLVHAGIIEKADNGEYQLTVRGKEIANTINRTNRSLQKQPKLSVLLIVTRQSANGQAEYLVQQRERQPFYHYWSFISGPTVWGEEPEASAKRELEKQTGLTTSQVVVHGFYRERGYMEGSDELLEDKLFAVVTCLVDNTELKDWSGGHNSWMTLQELSQQEKYFSSCLVVTSMLDAGEPYASRSEHYPADVY